MLLICSSVPWDTNQVPPGGNEGKVTKNRKIIQTIHTFLPPVLATDNLSEICWVWRDAARVTEASYALEAKLHPVSLLPGATPPFKLSTDSKL